MGEKELRALTPIQPEWSIPQLQENLAKALEGSGPALSTKQIDIKEVAKNIALVISTSGSTAESKLVAISDAALIASTNASHKYLGAVPGDSWSLLLPTTHIAGLNVLIRATALGSRVIDNRNATNYVDADFISIVPTQLYKALTSDAKLLEHLTAAEAVLVGGGPVSDKLKKEAANKHVKIVTTYGMTEMSGGCVYNQKPLDGVEIKLTSDGLIRLTGPMIASGYLSEKGELTSVGIDGWFESTDIGELSAGFLKVNGRSDEVIISGGENISLVLVEEKIRELIPNQEIIAFALPDEVWGEKLCLGSTSNLSIEEIRKSVGSLLSPKEVFLFEQIPTTSIGKPDRRAAKNLAIKIMGGN
jgi:O-succinylbenzoic acid--CoA ligase